MRPRIGTLAILGVALVTAVVIGAMAVIILRGHESALITQIHRSADQLSETIAGSTYDDMLENRRESLHREILTIGRQQGIEKVRLFNATGTIMFSSAEDEIGRSVDKDAEECDACHAAGQPMERLTIRERARIYRAADGHRVLGMIRPIHNERSCWSADCHAHGREEAVLGVLDVNLSLAGADAQIAGDQRRLALLAVLAIASSSLLLWWLSRRLILAPVAALIAGTRKLASGDLDTTIPVRSSNEMGDLAQAFNDMARSLSEARRQLTQADKLASVGRLAAGVAHEINNPLTGVLTYASFLRKRAGDNPELAENLDVIVRETKRCREIVRGLLDFSRQTPPNRQPTDLNEVVRRGVTVVMNQLSLAKVSLDLDLSPDLAPVPADANQIQQVIVNLLINAADAVGPEGGRIRIGTRAVAIPARGHAAIRAAACPRGCDLLDAKMKIGGLPAIRTLTREGDRDVLVHMDPVYGRSSHRAGQPTETGVVTSPLCPACRTRLVTPERACELCGAPVFAVQVKGQGQVEWCTRKGCTWTRWEAADAIGPKPYAEITVEDTGQGISADDMVHLFEPFFSTKGNRGSGLGLAVSWGILEGHGGSIDVASEPGEGTRFTVQLPYDAPAVPAAAAETTLAGAPASSTAAAHIPASTPSGAPASASPPAAPHRGTPAPQPGGAA